MSRCVNPRIIATLFSPIAVNTSHSCHISISNKTNACRLDIANINHIFSKTGFSSQQCETHLQFSSPDNNIDTCQEFLCRGM